MIRLSKRPKPKVLEDNEANWTTEFLDYVKVGRRPPKSVRFRYRHPDIKSTIREETAEKCAYCESKISHAQPGDTEHIRPVSKCPNLIVAWDNITYVCSECNREKGAYDSETEPLINPYQHDPDKHLTFYGPMPVQRLGNLMGYRTIRKVSLDRAPLILRRVEKLRHLMHLVERWSSQPDGPTKEVFRQEARCEANSDSEYAAMARAFLSQRAPSILE